MNDKINITMQNGSVINSDPICFIENVNDKRQYLYHTLNETLGTGANTTVKIYVSKIKQNDQTLNTPISDQEWNTLKDYMAKTLKGISLDDVKYLSIDSLTPMISISDKVIAMPTSYDYVTKQKAAYNESITKTQTIENSPETIVPESNNAIISNEEKSTILNAQDFNSNLQAEETSIESNIKPAAINQDLNLNSNVNKIPTKLSPIDLSDIEKYYEGLFEKINSMKEMELEAAKRYNATLEINNLHNEQHANYVRQEQGKENKAENNIVVEPTAVTPVVPEPEISTTQIINNQFNSLANQESTDSSTTANDIETNWFDMPDKQD